MEHRTQNASLQNNEICLCVNTYGVVKCCDMEQNMTPENKKGGLKSFLELVRYVVTAFIIVFIVRTYLAQPFVVSGSSMVPTFEDKEYLIVDEITYRFHEPQRGDVIVFRYPKNPSQFFIKRIIGLPGEKVIIDGSDVTIEQTDGTKIQLSEPYVKNKSFNEHTYTLNDTEYFVMGDNRAASSDSRSWGALEKQYIIGQPFIRLYPANTISWMPGKFEE